MQKENRVGFHAGGYLDYRRHLVDFNLLL